MNDRSSHKGPQRRDGHKRRGSSRGIAKSFSLSSLKKREIWVLDTSAVIHGQPVLLDAISTIFVLPSSVLEELVSRSVSHVTDLLLAKPNVRVEDPSPAHVRAVQKEEKALSAGTTLSSTDLDVIALALQSKGGILSDDYMIQNLARSMGIKYLAIRTKGIKKLRSYYWHCTACGATYETELSECDVCASPLQREIKRTGRRRGA